MPFEQAHLLVQLEKQEAIEREKERAWRNRLERKRERVRRKRSLSDSDVGSDSDYYDSVDEFLLDSLIATGFSAKESASALRRTGNNEREAIKVLLGAEDDEQQ